MNLKTIKNINILKMICSLFIVISALWVNSYNAEAFAKNDPIAVMDFGTRPGASPSEINIQNAEYTSGEYIINALVKSGFNVQDKDMVLGKLKDKNLKTVGIIDPDTAKEIGKILNVRYIMYGNVANVSTAEDSYGIDVKGIVAGVDVCTVKAHIIARIMDVETGNIVKMFKGDGESKSSFVEAGTKVIGTVGVGSKTVTMDSVHNAIRKAGEQAVSKLH